MYKIQEAEMLANNIYRMVVEAPRVAQHCLPGQFVIVKADEEGVCRSAVCHNRIHDR